MHVSPRPIRPFEDDPAPVRQGGRLPTLAFIVYALLAMTGTILLSVHEGSALQCGEDPAACGEP